MTDTPALDLIAQHLVKIEQDLAGLREVATKIEETPPPRATLRNPDTSSRSNSE